MNKRTWLMLAVVAVLCGGRFPTAWGGPIKVGIWDDENSAGVKGICEALKQETALSVGLITDPQLTFGALFKYDVIVIGSRGGVEESTAQAMRVYAQAGGGVLLHHDSCGYRKWAKPLFPEICGGGVRAARTVKLRPVAGCHHPMLEYLPPEFNHDYYDHIVLVPGPQGVVIVEDAGDGTSAVAVGQVGHGRVVANGCITGIAADNGEVAPRGGELQLLLNAVKWLGSPGVTTLPKEQFDAWRKEAGAVR